MPHTLGQIGGRGRSARNDKRLNELLAQLQLLNRTYGCTLRPRLSSPIREVNEMQETNVVELRKRIKHYFDAVEKGEVVRVYRNGKPIAEILPLTKREASWKREVPRLTVPGLSLSREVLKDRAESDA